ncbi:MAG: phage integrase SAM-like domain-containing protein [Spirosomataceae bacterium]
MSHQTDHQQAATVAPKKGNSGVFTVPTARFRVRKGSNRIEIIVRLLGKDANAKAINIQLKNGEQLNTKTNEITGNPHATAYLRKLRNELDELFYKLDREGQEFTAQDLSDYLFKKRDWRTHKPHVMGVIAAYNEYRKPEVASGLMTETVFKRFGRMERIMLDFLKYQYKKEIVALESLKPVFGKQLETYFKTVKKYDNATYVKYIRHYKSVLDYAVQNEWTNRNVLAAYKGKIEAKPLIYLREAEIQAIQDLNLIDPSLQAVRDGFVFMCFTGVSFADLVKLQPQHLKIVNDVWCLEKPREKQKRNFRNTHFVPLLPVADAILKRYATHL